MNSVLWPFDTWSDHCTPLVGERRLTEAESRLVSAIHRVPKAELHFHAEGAVAICIEEPAPRAELAGKPATFFSAWQSIIDQFQEYQDFRQAAQKIVMGFRRSKIVWAEVFVSPPDYEMRSRNPLPFAQTLLWWIQAFAEAECADCHIRIVADLVRLYPATYAEKWLDQLLEVKASALGASIAGIGLGGPEDSHPLLEYEHVISRAKSHGLLCVAHAGEMGSEEDVYDAVCGLGVRRIGHALGLRAGSVAYEQVKARSVAIESCPTASVRMGACSRLGDHPIDQWVRDGLSVTVSSDDPAVFRTELALEFLNLHRAFDWTMEMIAGVVSASFSHSTMPQPLVKRILQTVRRDLLA